MKNKRIFLYSTLLFAFSFAEPILVTAQKPIARIAFWNVENFFDTINDPKINDEEFLPEGKMKWNAERYNTKLNNLAKVILALGDDGTGPEILGMSEIENENVLNDLTQKTELKKENYGIVHYDSPDKRGIDVALIYKKNKFKVLDSKPVFVKLPSDTMFTRDILVVKGLLNKKDTMWICVNHWPSRRGGQQESDERRMCAANTLKKIEDSILWMTRNHITYNSRAKIIAIGDFNDEPTSESILSLTQCPPPTDTGFESQCFTDLMDSLKAAGDGSYHYKKEINMLDNILVNSNFQTKKGIYMINAYIFKPEFMIGTNYKDDPPGPLHTYAGTRYIGGYSDHFPVYADIYFSK